MCVHIHCICKCNKYFGAKIVLLDVNEDVFYIFSKNMKTVIASKTKAIIPIDIAGTMVTMIQSALGRIAIIADREHYHWMLYTT